MSKPIAAIFKKNEAFGASLRPGFYDLPDGEYELVEESTCDELAEALESLEMAYVQTCNNWLPSSWDWERDEMVIKARAALARYRGE